MRAVGLAENGTAQAGTGSFSLTLLSGAAGLEGAEDWPCLFMSSASFFLRASSVSRAFLYISSNS